MTQSEMTIAYVAPPTERPGLVEESTKFTSTSQSKSRLGRILGILLVSVGLVVGGPALAANALARPYFTCNPNGTYAWSMIGDDLVPGRTYIIQGRILSTYPGIGPVIYSSWETMGSRTANGSGVFTAGTWYGTTVDNAAITKGAEVRLRDTVTQQLIYGEKKSDLC